MKCYSRWGSVGHLCLGFFLAVTEKISHSPKSFCASKNLYSFAVNEYKLKLKIFNFKHQKYMFSRHEIAMSSYIGKSVPFPHQSVLVKHLEVVIKLLVTC